MQVIQALLHSRKFWLAVFGVAQSIVFALWPNFPPDLWKAIDALVIVLVAAIAFEDGARATVGR